MEAKAETSETTMSQAEVVVENQDVPLTGQATEFFSSVGAVWTSGTQNAWQAIKPVADSAAVYVPTDMKKALESTGDKIKGVFGGSVSPTPLYRAAGSVTPPITSATTSDASSGVPRTASPYEPASVVADASKAISSVVSTVGTRLNEAAVYTSSSAKGAYENIVQTVKHLPAQLHLPALPGKGTKQEGAVTATGESTVEQR